MLMETSKIKIRTVSMNIELTGMLILIIGGTELVLKLIAGM